MVTASVLDTDWHDKVAATGGPWFFSAEAVLIYLQPPDVTAALDAIGTRFPDTPIALDTWATWMRDHQSDHDTIGALDADFQWFCDDPATLELTHTTIEILERCTFPEAPQPVLDLLPPDLRQLLTALADDPQMATYHQNLLTLHPMQPAAER